MDLRLNRCSYISDNSIQQVARGCPKLKTLTFQENQRVSNMEQCILFKKTGPLFIICIFSSSWFTFNHNYTFCDMWCWNFKFKGSKFEDQISGYKWDSIFVMEINTNSDWLIDWLIDKVIYQSINSLVHTIVVSVTVRSLLACCY